MKGRAEGSTEGRRSKEITRDQKQIPREGTWDCTPNQTGSHLEGSKQGSVRSILKSPLWLLGRKRTPFLRSRPEMVVTPWCPGG